MTTSTANLCFIDSHLLDDALALQAVRPNASRNTRPRRWVTTVDDEVRHVRRNVQDAAEAVLMWVASLSTDGDPETLHRAMATCLRPGDDAGGLNISALAADIERVTGRAFSAKRIGTAIEHLRALRDQRVAESRASKAVEHVERSARQAWLVRSLHAFPNLHDDTSPQARRELAVRTLAAVRHAAGRLIANDFAEHLGEPMDLQSLASDLQDAHDATVDAGAASSAHVLRRVLRNADGSATSDMAVVLRGSALVQQLAGASSLPGVMARLNVAVAGRDLIPTPDYVNRMLELADAAEALHANPDAKRDVAWARKLTESERLPSPVRVMSYALNNAATHLLERLHTGLLPYQPQTAATIDQAIDRMHRRDPGFQLLRATRALRETTSAHLRGDRAEAVAFFAKMSAEDALHVLADLARFESHRPLVAAAAAFAEQAHPTLRHRLIRFG